MLAVHGRRLRDPFRHEKRVDELSSVIFSSFTCGFYIGPGLDCLWALVCLTGLDLLKTKPKESVRQKSYSHLKVGTERGMEEDERRQLLKQVFGDSSDDEDSAYGADECKKPTWEPVSEIKGLWLCRDFISPRRQSTLLSAVQGEGWFKEASNNQAMRFGDLPLWAIELSNSIREAVLSGGEVTEWGDDSISCGDCVLPSDLLWREPFFDQLIVNVYQPGEGICAHVDLMRFEDGIAIVSLESSCVMHFTQVREPCSHEMEEEDPPMSKISVYLTPGSLVILSGEARYLWKHEINRKPGFQLWEDKKLNQKQRTSITLRKLRHGEFVAMD